MRSVPADPRSKGAAGPVPPSMTAGLRQLLQAHRYAQELARPVWDFAVEFESLRAAGLTTSDLRWLVCSGYVEHAVETTPAGGETRTFSQPARLTFSQGSCFVLTASGLVFAHDTGEQAPSGHEKNGVAGRGNRATGQGRPRWDAESRTLLVGDKVVKQFRVPAENQELILAAFEELGWPPHIDDPLPPVQDLDPKQRLHHTIGRLNKNQKHALIRFHGDGNGRGLWWELRR